MCLCPHIVYTYIYSKYSREIKLVYSQWSIFYWTEHVHREVIKIAFSAVPYLTSTYLIKLKVWGLKNHFKIINKLMLGMKVVMQFMSFSQLLLI